ncbi:MAG: hypothetical protein K9M55_02400 [Candidatus Marinimicrobia bacterium]|nr:hypothetical protein [Candidatus Neomarinimicrobiota bacterium]MCF7921530.1 hypothetical protein [Candidatus Neomarinimicrobiota bacterium]
MIRIKKMVCVCSVFCTVIPQFVPVFGAFEYQGLGWPAATANIKVIGTHPSQFALNPALMQEAIRPYFILSYQKPFQSLNLQAGALTILSACRGRSTIHNLEYFGDEIYSELKASSGTDWKIQEGFKVGVTLNYLRLHMSGFSRQQTVTLSLSLLAELTDQFKIGSVVEHVAQWEHGLKIPQRYHVGTEYRLGMSTLLFALEKEAALPLEPCLGVLLSSQSFWELGFGYRDLSGMLSAGWRIHTERFAFYYVCVLHPQLPVSSGFGLELILR